MSEGLKFRVCQKKRKGAPWVALEADVDGLQDAMQTASGSDAFETGVFVVDENGAGALYWSSRNPEALNSVVLSPASADLREQKESDQVEVDWKLFVNCNSADASRRLSSAFLKMISRRSALVGIEPHDEGGFVVRLKSVLESPSWAGQVLEVIQLAQSVGYGWTLSGCIEEEIQLGSSATRIGGVQAIQIRLVNVGGRRGAGDIPGSVCPATGEGEGGSVVRDL